MLLDGQHAHRAARWRQRPMMASETCAPTVPNHPGDLPHVHVCGSKRLVMLQPMLSHLVCLQPPCASSWSLMWPDIVSRDCQLRSDRVLCVGLASLVRLTGTVAKKLTKSKLTSRSTCVVGPHGVDFVLVSSMLNGWFNVETWPCAVHRSWLGVRAACPVSLKLRLSRVHTW